MEVATLDPGLPASGDYDPETGILHLGIPKGDSGASAIATPTSLGSVMPQTGDEDGLTLEKDGKLRVRKATATQRGGVLARTTATANAVPQAGEDGTLDESWVPRPDYWDMFPPFVPVPIWGAGLGGSDGRRAIMPGESDPRENWVKCDGGSDGQGDSVPDLRGRMILCASDEHEAGSTGGSATHTHSLSGTVGETTLSVTQMPRHTHPAAASYLIYSAGSVPIASGNYRHASSDAPAAGGSESHTHTISGASGEANGRPPYYTLAYIMRCA